MSTTHSSRFRRAGAALLATLALMLGLMVGLPSTARAAVVGNDYPHADAPACGAAGRYCVGGKNMSPEGFYYRADTDFVSWRLRSTNGLTEFNTAWPGRGGHWSTGPNWYNKARALGGEYAPDRVPAVGAVATTGNTRTATVAWVAEVGEGTVTVEEYVGGAYNTRTVPTSTFWYIHIADLPANEPPVVSAEGPYEGLEGSTVELGGAASDPDGDALTLTWSYAVVEADEGTSCTIEDPSSLSTTIVCNDDGRFAVTLTADDGVNEPVSDTTELTLANVAPQIDTSEVPARVLPGQPFTISFSASDPGSNDTLTCFVDLGEGAQELEAQDGLCSLEASYSTLGRHTITMTVRDDDGGEASLAHEIDVVGRLVGDGAIAYGATELPFEFDITADVDEAGVLMVSGSLSATRGSTKLVSTSIDSVSFDGTAWVITGQARVNNSRNTPFTARVVDGSPDSFDLVAGTWINNRGALTRGDITAALS